MLHKYVRTFNVTSTVENFLVTKQGHNLLRHSQLPATDADGNLAVAVDHVELG